MLKSMLTPAETDELTSEESISPRAEHSSVSPELRGRKATRDPSMLNLSLSRENSPSTGRRVMNVCKNCDINFFDNESAAGCSNEYCTKDCEVTAVLKENSGHHSYQQAPSPSCRLQGRYTNYTNNERYHSPLTRRASPAIPIICHSPIHKKERSNLMSYPRKIRTEPAEEERHGHYIYNPETN